MTFEEMQKFIQANKGKSREELMQSLQQEARQQQAQGELPNTKMEEIYEKLSPMLAPAQKQKMREVIERLKQ